MKSLRNLCTVGGFAFSLLAAASVSHAQVLLTSGNFGGGSQGNVLVGAAINVGTNHIDANLNGAPAALDGIVNVDSDELITGQGQGQATFTPVDGHLNNICFSLKDGYGFDRFSLNPQGGSGPYKVSVDWVDATNTAGNTTFNLAGMLGSGNNRFGAEAQAGFHLTEVCFFAQDGSDLAKQARILDMIKLDTSLPPTGGEVPEPGSLAMLVGAGISGGLMLRRNRRR